MSPNPPPQIFTTTTGVTVTVNHEPEPEPEPEPELPEPFPRVTITPAPLPVSERNALMTAIHAEHGADLDRMLQGRRDLLPESKLDARQRVLMVLLTHLDRFHAAPRDVPSFFFEVIRKDVSNHKRLRRLPIAQGADGEEVPTSSWGPESNADFAECRAKIDRYLDAIPAAEAEVVRYRDFEGKTIEETALLVGRSKSTVDRQHKQGNAKLADLACDSERATAAGERLRPR